MFALAFAYGYDFMGFGLFVAAIAFRLVLWLFGSVLSCVLLVGCFAVGCLLRSSVGGCC